MSREIHGLPAHPADNQQRNGGKLCLEWTEKDPWEPARKAGEWADAGKTSPTLQPKRNRINSLPKAVKAKAWAQAGATAAAAVRVVAVAAEAGGNGAVTAESGTGNSTQPRLPATVVLFFLRGAT